MAAKIREGNRVRAPTYGVGQMLVDRPTKCVAHDPSADRRTGAELRTLELHPQNSVKRSHALENLSDQDSRLAAATEQHAHSPTPPGTPARGIA
jgi:hypothetical protein